MERESYVYRPHMGYQLLVWGVTALFVGTSAYLIHYGMECYSGGGIFIFMGVMLLLAGGVVSCSTGKSYCRIEIGQEGLMVGRSLYPWEGVENSGSGSEQRKLRLHFVTVAERTDEYMLFRLNSHGNTRWLKLYKRLYPEYMKMLVQIELYSRRNSSL